jgi:sugar phosphate permease
MPDLRPSRRLVRMQWLAVALCTAAITINYIDRSTLAIGNLKIRDEFGVSATVFGGLQSAWSIAYAFSQVPIGFVIDRVGPRWLLAAALVLWSIAQMAGGVVGTFTQFFWSRVGLGVFESPAFPMATRVIATWFRPKDRGRPTGVYTTSGDFGRLIGTPFLTWLMLAFDWKTMFVIMGLIGLVTAVIWVVLYRSPDPAAFTGSDRAYLEESRPKTAEPVSLRSWRSLFRFRSMWGLILGAFCAGYVIWMYGTWLPGYLEMQQHVSIARTGVLAMIPLACSIIGALVGGQVTDRLAQGSLSLVNSRKIPAVCGYLVSAAFCGAASQATGTISALACISASMFFLSFAQSGIWTLIANIAPPRYTGSVASIQNFGAYIGGTVSPLVTGMVVDRTGSFMLALVLGACVMAGAAICYLFIVKDPIPLDEDEGAAPSTLGSALVTGGGTR